jgi:hypothetical protein
MQLCLGANISLRRRRDFTDFGYVTNPILGKVYQEDTAQVLSKPADGCPKECGNAVSKLEKAAAMANLTISAQH